MQHVIILAMIFCAALLVMGAIVIGVLILKDKKTRSGGSEAYVEAMKSAFSETHNVRQSLERVQEEFKPGSVEVKAIDNALDHLDNSLFKDYDTAFYYVENVFESEEVESLHNAILEEVKRFRTLQIQTTKNQENDPLANEPTSETESEPENVLFELP